MVGSVIYIGVNTQHRESAQNTCLSRLSDTGAYRRDILLGDRAAHYCGFIQQYRGLIDQDIGLGIKLKFLAVGLQWPY